MFNTEITFSTAIYILIFLLLILIVLLKLAIAENKNDRNYHLKFLGLFSSGLIYNTVEGLLPDKRIEINIISQNIFAWVIGLGVAFLYFIFIKNEYDFSFIKKLHSTQIALFVLLALLFLFILPYTITDSLEDSRMYFLSLCLILLLFVITIDIHQQIRKIKMQNSFILRIHELSGIFGLLGLLSLPVTILVFGDNQFIEHTFFSFGFFAVAIDYFLYELRKKDMRNNICFDQLTTRETEILSMLLENPDLKYSEISQKLNISEKTLSAHLSKIYKKIGIKNKKEILEISKTYKNILFSDKDSNK
nr:helix-turn-helix transcriptional regulator [uncultured Chryseobacterium sp.]